VLVADQFAGQ